MLEGEISQINLIERLVELWREQFTGAIRFENDGIIKIIYFKGGDILSASTNDRSDSIDEILMRAGKVSREHVKQALARRKESETLGDAMLNLGYITRKELTWARRVQVVGVIRSINNWTNGSFTIVNDYLPKRDEGTLFPLPQVLVELIVTEQDRSAIEKALDGGAAVYAKAPDFEEVFRRLGLNEDAEAIVAQVNGSRNAADVASASGRDAFNVYKLLHAFATLGILTQAGKPQVKPEFSLGDDAVADAADLWTTEQAAPQFELDEVEAARQPTLEVPGLTMEEQRTSVASRSAWDMDEEEIAAPAAPAAKMPAWDTPPATVAVPIPAPVEPPAERAEEQWGFDEAQIETVKRASRPATRSAPAFTAGKPARPVKAKSGGKRTGLLIAILLIVLLAGGGYAGFLWWQKQQGIPAETVAAVRPAAKPSVTEPAPAPAATDTTMTIVDATATATQPPATTTAPTTSAPPPASATATTAPTPLTITSPAPAVRPAAPVATKPAPARVPAPAAEQGRVAELARQYAANPKGNFTVQIQILCNAANVEKAMKDGGSNVWFVPQTLGTRSCYRVFWGNFATREEAQRAMASVPAALRDPTAAVKPVPKPLP